MKYTALDFETGNAYYTSACSVGLSVFEDDRLLRQSVHLIRPPESVGPFHWYNVKIHGIRRSSLKNEPTFDVVWKKIRSDVEDSILVCHNAMFDTAVLCKCLEFYNLPLPRCRYICTVKVAQRMWPELENHKLDTVSQALGIGLNHHEAGSDAQACGLILQHAIRQAGCRDAVQLAEKLGIIMGSISPSGKTSCRFSGERSGVRKGARHS